MNLCSCHVLLARGVLTIVGAGKARFFEYFEVTAQLEALAVG